MFSAADWQHVIKIKSNAQLNEPPSLLSLYSCLKSDYRAFSFLRRLEHRGWGSKLYWKQRTNFRAGLWWKMCSWTLKFSNCCVETSACRLPVHWKYLSLFGSAVLILTIVSVSITTFYSDTFDHQNHFLLHGISKNISGELCELTEVFHIVCINCTKRLFSSLIKLLIISLINRLVSALNANQCFSEKARDDVLVCLVLSTTQIYSVSCHTGGKKPEHVRFVGFRRWLRCDSPPQTTEHYTELRSRIHKMWR